MSAKVITKGKQKNEVPHLILIIAVAASLVSLWPAVSHEFVNWDDIIYVMNNQMITNLSLTNISEMFTRFYMGNYHPLTLLSFAFDYHLSGLNPNTYHIHNLILHLINVVLTYILAYRLLNRKRILAFFVALIFGIHPMHVESVAWISERKDVLYTLWFLVGLITYSYYTKKKSLSLLTVTFLAFLLSLLTKAQAVTFPMAMVLIDYLTLRKFSWKPVVEKIPFFLASLFFGVLAIYAQKADNAINVVGISTLDAVFYGQFSLLVYLFKFLFPVHLAAMHGYPLNSLGRAPLYVFLSPLILALLIYTIYRLWRSDRSVVFGFLFFLLTIFPVLQFLPVGQALVAERYTYIPYFGLSVAAVFLINNMYIRYRVKTPGKLIPYAVAGFLLVFVIVSYDRSKVWHDSYALWTDVMKKYPDCTVAYVNRGYILNQYNRHQESIQDCDKGITIDPDNYKFYVNRAVAYRSLGMYQEAVNDFTLAIEKNPMDPQSYIDRGILYTDKLNEYDKGIADFHHVLKEKPDHENALFNMGVAFLKKNVYDSSLMYCLKSLEQNDRNAIAYYISGICYARREDFRNAWIYGARATSLGFKMPDGQLEQWKQAAGRNNNQE